MPPARRRGSTPLTVKELAPPSALEGLKRDFESPSLFVFGCS